MSGPRQTWVEEQRALARALGLSLDQWLAALDRAGGRTTGLTAAVVGAAVAQGLGLGVVAELDGPALARRARAALDPRPPRAENPVLREAIRRAPELATGGGLARLKAEREQVSTPRRGEGSLGDSVAVGTPDAPGEEPS